MGVVLEGCFRQGSEPSEAFCTGEVIRLTTTKRATKSARGAGCSPEMSVDIDAITQFGLSLGRYVGCRIAAERAKLSSTGHASVQHHGQSERLDAWTLEEITEEIRVDDVQGASKTLGRAEVRQVTQAFRIALSRILDGP